ncbi:MAG TPA: glycosyltransferase family 4 protein [Roseimicrobium sp.]|nr:glycosyltransferase family 4 protein [Roseimicrobium sp.]
MKVLQILPELNSGGVERGTLEVSKHLVDNGHESLVISNGGRLVDALVARGARHITLPVHRKHLASFLQVSHLRRVLETERPDILHIRSRVPGWLAWLAWRQLPKATRPHLVSTVHGFYSVNLYSSIMTRGEHVIAVSESVRAYVLNNYRNVPSGKLTAIHRGVDPADYSPSFRPAPDWMQTWRDTHPALDGKIVLLLPARLTRWKGQEDFLQLVASLKKTGLPVHGLLVGEAHVHKKEFEEELRQLARKLEIESDVSFLGHRQDLREIMHVSSFVFSLSNTPEAFGRVSLEAMALGKPVIAYDHGGVGEQLRAHFPEGLVPPGDVERACACVRDLLARPSCPRPLRPEFTLQHMLEATMGVYRQLLQPSTARES